jgi:hypothetical protein
MWVFSSGSLASGYCKGEFSLFHEEFTCRQPDLALILWLATGIGCILLFVFGYKNYKRGDKVT